MKPTLLHFIICERVYTDPMNLHRINIEGLRTSIRSESVPSFPCFIPRLTILAVFMGGQGPQTLSTRTISDESGNPISASSEPRPINFIGDPREIKGVKVFVPNCNFRRPGLYWVELLLSGKQIARQPLFVR
jgi:hypothetical protein